VLKIKINIYVVLSAITFQKEKLLNSSCSTICDFNVGCNVRADIDEDIEVQDIGVRRQLCKWT
jgi:hypothetical protein